MRWPRPWQSEPKRAASAEPPRLPRGPPGLRFGRPPPADQRRKSGPPRFPPGCRHPPAWFPSRLPPGGRGCQRPIAPWWSAGGGPAARPTRRRCALCRRSAWSCATAGRGCAARARRWWTPPPAAPRWRCRHRRRRRRRALLAVPSSLPRAAGLPLPISWRGRGAGRARRARFGAGDAVRHGKWETAGGAPCFGPGGTVRDSPR